jgi:hypothetical protein
LTNLSQYFFGCHLEPIPFSRPFFPRRARAQAKNKVPDRGRDNQSAARGSLGDRRPEAGSGPCVLSSHGNSPGSREGRSQVQTL